MYPRNYRKGLVFGRARKSSSLLQLQGKIKADMSLCQIDLPRLSELCRSSNKLRETISKTNDEGVAKTSLIHNMTTKLVDVSQACAKVKSSNPYRVEAHDFAAGFDRTLPVSMLGWL